MKKILAMALAVVMLITLAVGCSKQPADTDASSLPEGESISTAPSDSLGADDSTNDGTETDDTTGDPTGDATETQADDSTTTMDGATATGGEQTDASGDGTKSPSKGTQGTSKNTKNPSKGTQAPSKGTQAPSKGTQAPSGGASKTNSSTPAGNNQGGSVTTSTTHKANSSFQATGYVKDLKGRTIRYGYNTYFEAPDPTTPEGKKTQAHYNEIEKKLNCKIVWNPKKLTHEQTLMGILSGTPEVDIIMSWGVSDLYDYCQKKYVTALDTLNVVDFSDLETYGSNIQYGVYKDHYYGIPVRDAGWNGIPLLFYNKAVLKKAGYTPESLNQLQESGKWTWDMFYTVLEKVKATGSVDKPLSDGALQFYNTLMASNGTDWVSKKADGSFVFTADSPKGVEVMNYYSKLTQLGLIENVEAGEVSSVWYDINRGAASQAAFWMSWVGMTELPTFPKSDTWGAMYPPKKDASSKYVSPNTTIQFYSVAAGVSKPAEVLTVMSEMVKPFLSEKELSDSRKAAIMATVSDKYTLNNFLTAGNIEVFTNTDFAAAANILIGNDEDGWNFQVAKIASGQMTMAKAIQSYKKVYNNRLKELFN